MKEMLKQLEETIINQLGWPSWALRLIAGLSALVFVTMIFQQYILSKSLQQSVKKHENESQSTKSQVSFKFRVFQMKYLSVYLITMLADWLQGTNMYTLYSSYGVNVGTLFLTGFLTSAVFGTFLGMYVDKWGRKTGCIIFCLLEVVINLLEHIPSMPVLLLGRVLGGLSTSLLFTAFESWMVSEHRREGFDEELLSATFSIASAGNGLMAIIAGLLAQRAADVSGDIGPFQLAIILTIVSLVLILPWNENYGHEESESMKGKPLQNSSFFHSIQQSLKVVFRHPEILLLGLSQAFFEGAVYTFVFMWVPSLMLANQGSIPTGLVFSAFMLAMTFGGMIFSLLLPIFPGESEGLSIFIYLLSAVAMFIPIYSFQFESILFSFLILESMVGMFNSCSGLLRSRYYPEGIQSSLMSLFRFPLNVLVVIGTNLANRATNDIPSLTFVFKIIVGMHLTAMALQISLLFVSSSNNHKKQRDVYFGALFSFFILNPRISQVRSTL